MMIRSEQIKALSKDNAKTFEERMAVHLRKCFRSRCDAMGEQKVLETIRYGVDRAASYDVKSERDLCRYIDLMMVFGRDFDRSPDLPWASKILNDGVLKSPTAKIERLYTEAKEH